MKLNRQEAFYLPTSDDDAHDDDGAVVRSIWE